MRNKREKEEHFYTTVRSKIDGFPEFDEHTDKPDFLVRDQAIGIEITCIFHNQLIQQEHAERRKIIELARTQCMKAGVRPLRVSVHFSDRPTLRGSDRGHLADRLSTLVCDNLPPDRGCIELENEFDDLDRFPEKLHHVDVTDYGANKHLWQSMTAGAIIEDFAGRLQSILDVKASKFPEYLKQCARCWLIVAADWEFPSSFFEFSDAMQNHDFESPFERVFFVDGFTGDVFELRIRLAGRVT